MSKASIEAEIEKIKNNKFLPQAVKDVKIKKLKEQLEKAAPAKATSQKKEKSASTSPKPKKGKATKGKKTPNSALQTLIDELTDINIDLDDADENLLAGFRLELEDNKHDLDKIEDVIGEFRIGPKIQDDKADKEVEASIKKYYATVPDQSKPKAKKEKKGKAEYTYKSKKLKELNEDECAELLKQVKERRKNQAKAEKKSKSKPVIEKVASKASTIAKQVIKNVPASEIKDNPTKVINKMLAVEQATKEYLNKLKSILGDDFDKEAVEGELKEVHALIIQLKKKYA